jgi:serine phosphatase RsbU (regulator of sigma subunit)
LRFAAERSADPGAVLRDANARLAPDLGQGLNVAVLLVVIDPATGAASIANAGHRPLLHLHAKRGSVETVHSEGVPLGADVTLMALCRR